MQFIEAKDKNLGDVLSNNRYKIDSFQREYRWQRKHIEALISDLCICFDKFYNFGDTIENYEDYGGYYMGPIVLCDDKKSLSIVDGQQRLTSFTLLLIFLHHAQFKLQLVPHKTKDLRQFLYVNKGGKSTLVLNVESRNEVIEHLFNNPNLDFIIDSDNKDESIQNIIERFEDITKLFPEEFNTETKLPIFIEWMLDKIVMVEVKAYSMDNAYTIFETMNDRGLSLNPTEILKGFLLSKIEDEIKSDEMNDFWKIRISEIKSTTGVDGDLDFFRAWLRAKYAVSIRLTKVGAENEDFEILGTQFHSWVKNNSLKTFLKHSDDFYFFIRSDFDFFSNLYIKIFNIKNKLTDGFSNIYSAGFYPIADSLSYPMMLSSISKIDSSEVVDEKIRLTAKFIDIYTLYRVVNGRTITQSSIRYSIYELVKSIRNLDVSSLKQKLLVELEKSTSTFQPPSNSFQQMDNWGFYHYLFARILYQNGYVEIDNFSMLMRSKKQNSYILVRIFENDEIPSNLDPTIWENYLNSIGGYCLIRRYDFDEFSLKRGLIKVNYLMRNGYLKEFNDFQFDSVSEFLKIRNTILIESINDLLNFKDYN